MGLSSRRAADSRGNVMADEEEVHFTFADNFAPYFLLIFSPLFVITCLFGILYSFLTTEVRFCSLFSVVNRGKKKSKFATYAPINSETSTPPPGAMPRAFELLKIDLFKFPPPWSKIVFKYPTLALDLIVKCPF